jgi:hypothetical protein
MLPIVFVAHAGHAIAEYHAHLLTWTILGRRDPAQMHYIGMMLKAAGDVGQ